jgi:hypothetical protein
LSGNSKQLIEPLTLAPNVVDVQRAVNLPAFATRPDHTAKAKDPKVPGDPRLTHPKVRGEVVHADLTHLAEALQDAQACRIGKGHEMVRQFVSRALEKHKEFFIHQLKA